MAAAVPGRPRLATRLTLAMVALLLAIYVILLAGYGAGVQEQRQAEVDDAVLIGRMSAAVVDAFRGDLERTLLTATLSLGERPGPMDQPSTGAYLDGITRGYQSLRALFVTDPQGRVIASQAAAGVGTDVSGRPYIAELQEGAESVWSGGLAGVQTGQTTIAHARSIRAPDGRVRGYLVAAFQPPAVVERLPIALAPDSTVVLIDENGRVLFASQSAALDSLADMSTVPTVQRALAGETVRLDGDATMLAPGPEYGALVPVGNTGWVVGYTRPLASLEAAVRGRLIQQALAVTLVMLVAAGVITYLTRRLLRPLRSLVGAAAAVARGERARVGVEGGDADVLELAAAMDAMSEAVMEREEALRDETRLVETLRHIGETLAAELDLEKLVQVTTDAVTEVTGAEYGTFVYNDGSAEGQPFPGEGIVRLDDVASDPRYSHNLPFQSTPADLPVRSYLAAPVISRSGEVIGGLFMGHSRAGVFSARAERLARGVAAQAAVAIDNARLYREAQDAIRLRDQFLSIASHELRTPLAAIKTTAQSAYRAHARGRLDPERLERTLATISLATDRVTRLASDLLDVARLRTGQMPIEHQAVDITGLLESLATSFREQWQGQRRLELESGLVGLTIDGDAGRLEQVFGNLIDNAAKYSPDGSPVRVAARQDDGGVRVSVADEGIGLPGGASALLFEPFGRASNAVAQHIQGLGLGLYISRQIVEAHSGRIWAESAGEDRGTTFHVWLPHSPPAT